MEEAFISYEESQRLKGFINFLIDAISKLLFFRVIELQTRMTKPFSLSQKYGFLSLLGSMVFKRHFPFIGPVSIIN